MLGTGMRRGEALGLHWTDVHLPEKTLLVRWNLTPVNNNRPYLGHPKTKASRNWVSLSPRVAAALERQAALARAGQPPGTPLKGLVFRQPDGSPLRPQGILTELRGAARINTPPMQHPGFGCAARAPPLPSSSQSQKQASTPSTTRAKSTHLPVSGEQAPVNENTRIKTLAAATARAWDAFVIVVGMLKGGTGKTTSAWFIALYYAVILDLPTLLLDADATSQSAYDWFKVAQAEGFEIPANLVVERYPFDDIAEYIREKRAKFGAIVVDAGGGSAKLFHEAVTEANRLLVPVAPTKIERRKLVATFDEAERAAARNTRDVTAHVVLVKADDRTSLPRNAKDKLLEPEKGEGIGQDRDEPFPLAETVIHSWVHYMEAFGEIPTELSEYAELMKELTA
nr:hypothetical protein [Streptomyces scabichelini]